MKSFVQDYLSFFPPIGQFIQEHEPALEPLQHRMTMLSGTCLGHTLVCIAETTRGYARSLINQRGNIMFESINVLGGALEPCSIDPKTGFYRDGSCNCGEDNPGVHAVCIYATEEFLAYSKQAGNDLSTPMPQYNFAGVKPGQSWCLSGPRFVQAVKDGHAPHIFLHSTHQAILQLIDLETLKKYALDL